MHDCDITLKAVHSISQNFLLNNNTPDYTRDYGKISYVHVFKNIYDVI